MFDDHERGPLIVDRGGMRHLRGWWFLLWCAVALLLGLAFGSVWRLG
jgi:hypothetical protein